MKCDCPLAHRCVHAEPVDRPAGQRYLRGVVLVGATLWSVSAIVLLCRLAYATAAGWGW